MQQCTNKLSLLKVYVKVSVTNDVYIKKSNDLLGEIKELDKEKCFYYMAALNFQFQMYFKL